MTDLGGICGLPPRVFSKIQPEPMSGCWLWTGALHRAGYGNVYKGGGKAAPRYQSAHRFVYEALVGPIPEGLTLDHLCRNPPCVNPSHLNPCTQRENTFAPHSQSTAKLRALITHCPAGHEYTGRNTFRSPKNQRHCRKCRVIRAVAYKRRRCQQFKEAA